MVNPEPNAGYSWRWSHPGNYFFLPTFLCLWGRCGSASSLLLFSYFFYPVKVANRLAPIGPTHFVSLNFCPPPRELKWYGIKISLLKKQVVGTVV